MFNTRKSEPSNNQKQTSVDTQRAVVSAEQKTQSKTIISKECHIKGDVSGNNDMSVFGKIEGTITLKNNSVTIEKSAKINADIFSKVVNVNGNIKCNIEAGEKIVITNSGNVSMIDTKVNTAPININKDVKTQTNKLV